MTLKIQTRRNYGKFYAYPMCERSKLLASLKHAKNPTFSAEDMKVLKKLGYELEQVPLETT